MLPGTGFDLVLRSPLNLACVSRSGLRLFGRVSRKHLGAGLSELHVNRGLVHLDPAALDGVLGPGRVLRWRAPEFEDERPVD